MGESSTREGNHGFPDWKCFSPVIHPRVNLCCVIKSLRLQRKTPAEANSSCPSSAALVLMLSSVRHQKVQMMKLPWGAIPELHGSQHQVVSFEIHIPLSSSHYIYVTDFQKGSVLIFLHGRRWREGGFWPLFPSLHPGLPEDKQRPFLSPFPTQHHRTGCLKSSVLGLVGSKHFRSFYVPVLSPLLSAPRTAALRLEASCCVVGWPIWRLMPSTWWCCDVSLTLQKERGSSLP